MRGVTARGANAAWRAVAMLLVFALMATSCARRTRRPPQLPPLPAPAPTEPAPTPQPGPPSGEPLRVLGEGLASWYGVPFHGRRTSNGEVYDMYKPTAAHKTLPFDTIVRVTNLKNGRKTDVRINDRGPFVEGRVIDLSLAAARDIDMVADGVVQVRLEMVSGSHPLDGLFTVQVGAFQQRENAVRLRQSLERKYQPIFIHEYDSPRGLFYRVRVGRVSSEAAAKRLAERLRRDEGFSPFVIRLDEQQALGVSP